MGLSWPAKNRDQPGLCINCFRKNTPLTSVDSLSRDQGPKQPKNCGEPALCRAGVHVREGSNSEILALSRCFPLCLQTQTLLDALGTSHLYQLLYSFTRIRGWPVPVLAF